MRRTCRRTPDHDAEAGLTLAEMLVVLAILALVAGLVVGRGLPGQGPLRSATLVSYLRDLRARAMEQGVPVRIGALGHWITDGAAGFDLGPGALVRIRSQDGTIVFAPDGASAGGQLVVLGADGGTWGAEVAAITGGVTALQP